MNKKESNNIRILSNQNLLPYHNTERFLYKPNNENLKSLSLPEIRRTRTKLNKFKNPTKKQREYNKQIERIHRAELRLKKEGYNIEKSLIPSELPKRVTDKTIKSLKNIKPKQIRRNSTKVLSHKGVSVVVSGDVFYSTKKTVKNSPKVIKPDVPVKSTTPNTEFETVATSTPAEKTPTNVESSPTLDVEPETATKLKGFPQYIVDLVDKINAGLISKVEEFREFERLSEADRKSFIEAVDEISVSESIQRVMLSQQSNNDDKLVIEDMSEDKNVEFPEGMFEKQLSNDATDVPIKFIDNSSIANISSGEMSMNEQDVEYWISQVEDILLRLPESRVARSNGNTVRVHGIREKAQAVFRQYVDDFDYYESESISHNMDTYGCTEEEATNQAMAVLIMDICERIPALVDVIIYESSMKEVRSQYSRLLDILSQGNSHVVESVNDEYDY